MYNKQMTIKERLNLLSFKKSDSILSASIVLALTFAISAILGYLRSRFLYAAFFKCCVLDLDAYNAAFRIPDLIFKLLVTGALSASFIPVFTSHLHRDEKEAYKMASTVINLLLIVFIAASLIVLVFARPLAGIIASGFTPSQLDLMANLTRLLLIAQIFFLVSNFLTGILQVHQIFLIPALSPILYNIFIIASIFLLAPIFGIYGPTYGAIVGAFFHLFIQLPSIKKVGFKYSVFLDTNMKGVKEVIRLMIPRTLSLGLDEIENTVTLFFASSLAAGSLSLLNLAIQLMYLPSRIFGTTVGQASLPILSNNIAKNELEQFRSTVTKTILQSLFIALPLTVLTVILRVPLVRIAFGAKQFPWNATLITARTLAYLAPAIATQSVIQILIRSFYALHNTRTPLKISIVSLVVSIIIDYYSVKFTNMGIVGLALSDSVGNVILCFGLLYFFIKKVDGFNWGSVYNRVLRIVLSSGLMGVVIWFSVKVFDLFVLDTTRTLNLLVVFSLSSVIGLASYILFSSWFCKDELFLYQKYYLKLRQKYFNKQ